MEYKCNDCKKSYSSYQSLWIHNKKFHNFTVSTCIPNVSASIPNVSINIPKVSNENIQSKTICKYCKKEFSTPQNKWKHENRACKQKNSILTDNNKINELENKINELKNIITSQQIIPFNQSKNTNSHNSQTNNGTINNTLNNKTQNNTINNNTVTINKIGNEAIKFRTKDIKMIANDGMNGPITCARQLNFNKNNPENHSYCITSLESEYCKAINHETQKPEVVPKKDIIDQVFESAYKFIESIAAQIKEDKKLRNKLSKHEIKEIERIVANKNKYYEKKNRKIFYNSVNSMGYNYRELVLSTWKLLKPLEENLITNIESSDSDNEIKEVTEFPDINELSDSTSDSDSDDDFNLLTAYK